MYFKNVHIVDSIEVLRFNIVVSIKLLGQY